MLRFVMIGADPELFAFNTITQQYISAHSFIPGTKEKPFPLSLGAVQLDGMAAEINIDPAGNRWDFINNIETTLHQIRKFLPYGVELLPTPAVKFTQIEFDNVPPRQKELGCSPDFCAWRDGDVNPAPENIGTLRAAGGHIHVGWDGVRNYEDEEERMQACALIKQLDAYVGLASLEWDRDDIRRDLYGKAGAMRFKPYGVEYRTLSSAWLRSADLMGKVYDLTWKAVRDFNNNKLVYDWFPEIPEIINTGNREKAKEIHDAILAS